MIAIPAAFAQQYIWTFDDATSVHTPTPDTRSSADLDSGLDIRVSTGVTTQISSLLSFAFSNIEKPLQSEVPFLDAPLNNKAVIVTCTQSQGAQIIDTAVKQVAREQGADVLVLDALELARGRFGILGRGQLRSTLSVFLI
jgi:hypothetical protein